MQERHYKSASLVNTIHKGVEGVRALPQQNKCIREINILSVKLRIFRKIISMNYRGFVYRRNLYTHPSSLTTDYLILEGKITSTQLKCTLREHRGDLYLNSIVNIKCGNLIHDS